MLLLMVKRKIDPKPPLVSADVRKKDVKSICSTPMDFVSICKYLEMIDITQNTFSLTKVGCFIYQ